MGKNKKVNHVSYEFNQCTTPREITKKKYHRTYVINEEVDDDLNQCLGIADDRKGMFGIILSYIYVTGFNFSNKVIFDPVEQDNEWDAWEFITCHVIDPEREKEVSKYTFRVYYSDERISSKTKKVSNRTFWEKYYKIYGERFPDDPERRNK